MAAKIGFICPTYDAIVLDGYTRKALSSFFANTPDGVAIVVDDGSTDWNDDYEQSLRDLAAKYHDASIHIHHFAGNGGLTRSWNKGLAIADELGLDYAIAGNNDIVFSTHYYPPLLQVLERGYALVGPLSNAPGITAKGRQEIDRHFPDYELSDDDLYVNTVSVKLQQKFGTTALESPINGFFQMAKMESWRAGKYDETYYYRPVNTHTSRGQRNPTPLMTLNEDELQERWRAKGMKAAIALGSFIFHYRAVSRGDRYKRGKWYRQT